MPYRIVYDVYIASPGWEARKVEFFARHERRCAACGAREAIQLHHRSYERFTREVDDDLRALCSTCHVWVHHLERTSAMRLAAATDAVIAQGRSAAAAPTRPEPVHVGRQRSSMEGYFAQVRARQRAAARAAKPAQPVAGPMTRKQKRRAELAAARQRVAFRAEFERSARDGDGVTLRFRVEPQTWSARNSTP